MDARVVWVEPELNGVSIPLLLSLLDDYSERRRRELHEDAVAGALAHHSPKDISSLRDGSDGDGNDYTDPDESEYETGWNH